MLFEELSQCRVVHSHAFPDQYSCVGAFQAFTEALHNMFPVEAFGSAKLEELVH